MIKEITLIIIPHVGMDILTTDITNTIRMGINAILSVQLEGD